MKNTSFLAFPPIERQALLQALHRAGIAPRGVCVSRFELALPAARGNAYTAVTAPGWVRTYATCDWPGALERELARTA